MRTEIITIDNFYEDPDTVRTVALSFDYTESINYKGFRSFSTYKTDYIHNAISKLVGFEPKYHGASWQFHYTLAGTPEVYHTDGSISQWGAIWYGNPNPPIESGTSFYKSKINGFRSAVLDKQLFNEAHKTPEPYCFIDPTNWQLIDFIGNVYNRLVLFRGDLVHSMNKPFGFSKETGRLTQLWFISE